MHNKGNLHLSPGFHFFFFSFSPASKVPFVFLTLPKYHHNSLRNFVATNCLTLFVFGVKFSKVLQSKSRKDSGSVVMAFMASSQLSVMPPGYRTVCTLHEKVGIYMEGPTVVGTGNVEERSRALKISWFQTLLRSLTAGDA